MRKVHNNQGSILFLILISVVLLAALSYAITQSMSQNQKDSTSEQAELDQAVLQGYLASVDLGRQRLEVVKGCTNISYAAPSEWGIEDKACHIFHPNGAGVIWQDLGVGNCDLEGVELTDLEIGEACDDVIYFGSLSGTRLYTLSSMNGHTKWSTNNTNSPADSDTDGKANTDALLAAGDTSYPAAESCRSLGDKWYLPARNELLLLLSNGNIGALSSALDNMQWYWASTEFDTTRARRARNFSPTNDNILDKTDSRGVQCIRQD